MNASYGLVHVWTQGDGVTRAVPLILQAMSLASWLVILFRLLDLRRLGVQTSATEAFWRAKDVAAGLQAIGGEGNSPFLALALE